MALCCGTLEVAIHYHSSEKNADELVEYIKSKIMWDVVADLKKDGVTIILTTHYIEEAEAIIMNLMSELHKDNSGYCLRDLVIGAEGTLGIITQAVLKLFPRPKAYATAMVAVNSLDTALSLLNELQDGTGGAVAAYEYLSTKYY